MQWDVFCRVVDNFGDIGVCWRLAADLASRGESVRLWTDDSSALAWMAPDGAAGVQVLDWPGDLDEPPPPGDVVIEGFGCDPPARFVEAMAKAETPPVWINLEYLSAESYVERCHGLRSPQLSGPGQGLDKWFFYPGFTAATGGLIREHGLLHAQRRPDAARWLASLGIVRDPGERLVSVFCYDHEDPAGTSRLAAFSAEPTLLLMMGGVRPPASVLPSVRIQCMPRLSQVDYDHLLHACDLNVVRGEDSFVRAQWAGRPFIWQIYPQSDGAHAVKLDAYLDKFLAGAAPGLPVDDLRALWKGWNGLGPVARTLPPLPAWVAHCERWRTGLQATPDLVSTLSEFIAKTR